MLVPPGYPVRVERHPRYLPTITVIGAIAVGVFAVATPALQWILLVVLAISLGRIAVFWSRNFLGSVPRNDRGTTISTVLAISYGILYLFNAVTPSLPAWILPPAVALLVLLTIPFFQRVPPGRTFLLRWKARGDEETPLRRRIPFFALIVVFLIYIVAGFTYTGIFPRLSLIPADRWYNVLPFVLVVPLAGRVSDRFGRITTLGIGVAAVGSALVFFQLPSDALLYYPATQTLVQIGWAFLDVYVWVWAADLVFDYKNAQLQNVGVATFLLGTDTGAAVTIAWYPVLIEQRQFYLLAIPLFVATALMTRIVAARAVPPPLNYDSRTLRHLPASLRTGLTEREQEIALLLVTGRKNREICDHLHVSPNTLKTHCRHIYRKLDVENRLELRQLVQLSSESVDHLIPVNE